MDPLNAISSKITHSHQRKTLTIYFRSFICFIFQHKHSHIYLFLLGWLLQIWLAIRLPLVADEAYYLSWSSQLSLGYYDHLPAVAVWWRFGGRILNLTLVPIALWLIAYAGATLKVPKWYWLPAVIVWTPLGSAAGILVTPDIPLLCAWAMCILGTVHRIVWITCLGLVLALWSKPMALVAWVGLIPIWGLRSWFKISIISTVCFLPHLYWSATHHWLPWSFQSSRPMSGGSPFEFIGGQLLFITPLWTFIGSIALWVYAPRLPHTLLLHRTFQISNERQTSYETQMNGKLSILRDHQSLNEQHKTLWWMSAPTLLFWLTMSLFTRVEANWPLLAWPPLLLLSLNLLCTAKAQSIIPQWITMNRAFITGFIITCPLVLLPWVHSLIPIGQGPPRDGVALFNCFRAQANPTESPTLIAGRYQEAALLSASQHPVKYLPALNRRGSEYDFNPDLLQSASSPLIPIQFQPLRTLMTQKNQKVQTPHEQTKIKAQSTVYSQSAVNSKSAVYLGPSHWLGDRCEQIQKLIHLDSPPLFPKEVQRCGMTVTLCTTLP